MGSSRGLGFVVQLTITYSFWHRLQSLFLLSPWLHSPQDVPAPTHHLCSVQVTPYAMVLGWVPRLVPEPVESEQAGRKEPAGAWDSSWGRVGGSQLGGLLGSLNTTRMKRVSMANTTWRAQIKTSQPGRQGFTA